MVMATLVPEIVGQRVLGKATAFMNACGVICAGLGPVLWSLCKDRYGSYLFVLKSVAAVDTVVLVWVLVIIVWGGKTGSSGVNKKDQ